jgi:DNA-binding transcriptional regulator GbsR (MarR family)
MKMEQRSESGFLGPLTVIFENPIARVLDQSLLVGDMEQTTSILAESTGLSYKTVQIAIEKLEKLGFMKATRKIGNARAYKFEVKNDLHELLECAQNLQIKRLKNEASQLHSPIALETYALKEQTTP